MSDVKKLMNKESSDLVDKSTVKTAVQSLLSQSMSKGKVKSLKLKVKMK